MEGYVSNKYEEDSQSSQADDEDTPHGKVGQNKKRKCN